MLRVFHFPINQRPAAALILAGEVRSLTARQRQPASGPRMAEVLQLRSHGDPDAPALVYLPGIHGDWTLVGSFRAAMAGAVRFIEFTYPRTVGWSLADYAGAVEEALLAAGTRAGWVLAESFGSQVAWPLVAQPRGFQTHGLLLAGGFGRHPLPGPARGCRRVCAALPLRWLHGGLRVYAGCARFRYRHAPETLADLAEFVARRSEADRRAVVHRLDLIAANDPAPLAERYGGPVHYLTGLADPVVPWPLVPGWLRRHCPGYRGMRIVPPADHAVLATAPVRSAALVRRWIAGTG